ncbi:13569_t:CDS:2, partial [Dentiscutata heterogama]
IEDGKEYIGRVVFPVYPQWKTKSEVAVMKYIYLNTNIPVPKVYYWNSFANNPVGAEYMLIEYLPEYILDVIRNLIYHYKSKDTQKCLISKYEELCKLVPKYFQNDENDMFVLIYRDFHSSNILVKNDEISKIIDWECSGTFLIENGSTTVTIKDLKEPGKYEKG